MLWVCVRDFEIEHVFDSFQPLSHKISKNRNQFYFLQFVLISPFSIPYLSAPPFPVPAYISQFFKKNLSYLDTVHPPFCAALHCVSPLSLYDNRVSCEYTALAGCTEAGSLTCGTNILWTLLWFIMPSLHLLFFCLCQLCVILSIFLQLSSFSALCIRPTISLSITLNKAPLMRAYNPLHAH